MAARRTPLPTKRSLKPLEGSSRLPPSRHPRREARVRSSVCTITAGGELGRALPAPLPSCGDSPPFGEALVLDGLLGALVKGDAAGAVEREQHQAADDRERLEKVVTVKVHQPLVDCPERIHVDRRDAEHGCEQHGGPLRLEADAHQAGEAEQQQRARHAEEARPREDLVQPAVLRPERLEEEQEGEQQPSRELQPIRAALLRHALRQPHVLAPPLPVVLRPDEEEQPARKRHRTAHEVQVPRLPVHKWLDADEREEPVARGLDARWLDVRRPQHERRADQLRRRRDEQAEHAKRPVEFHHARHVLHLLSPAHGYAKTILDKCDDQKERPCGREE
mmetsp:Transcript_47923/g.103809  ORF Transcript_47923/g.103809 Transcript_47923/m.103809 type:complete len:335 (+) Transcript_47923:394-1398(+)